MDLSRDYQLAAVQKITDFYFSDEEKAKLYISTGLGKNIIVSAAIEKILKKIRYVLL